MKTATHLVVLFTMGVLLVFGLIGLLAEPIGVRFDAVSFIVIKALFGTVVYIGYRGVTYVLRVM